jgi:hypothetical protein
MSSASFQIVSDLHLETRLSYNFELKQTAPNLAFLGDIGQVVDDGLFAFLEKQLSRYWNVIFVLGNHEPAMTSWLIAKQRVHNFADRMRNLRAQSTIGRFIFLDQTRYDIDDTVTILGCTLFSKVTEEQIATVADRLIDFKQIRQWTIEDHLNAHKSDLEWLNSQVLDISRSQPQRQIAIFTHYSPTLDDRAVDEKHRNSMVASGFSTDLSENECWTNPSVVMWAFGHTHFNCDYIDHIGKRVVSNQAGYASVEEKGFNAKKVFFLRRMQNSPNSLIHC